MWLLALFLSPQSEAGIVLDSALEATVDAQEWRLEVERVLPSLKIHVRQDNRVRWHVCSMATTNENLIVMEFGKLVLQDWRGHYEQMHTHSDGITAALSETKGHLDKLHQEIIKALEKIGSREKYINNQVWYGCMHANWTVLMCLDTSRHILKGAPSLKGLPPS